MSGVMVKSANSRAAILFTALLGAAVALFSGVVHADSTNVDALRAQLEEAKRMLEQDSASHRETQEKMREIDALLEARKARAAEIQEEMRQLCETHDKLNPGSFDQCIQNIGD